MKKKTKNDVFVLNQLQIIDSIVMIKSKFQEKYSRINDAAYNIILIKNGFDSMFAFIQKCIYLLSHGEDMIYDIDERNFIQKRFETRYNELLILNMMICN